jgi:hypothetical protein
MLEIIHLRVRLDDVNSNKQQNKLQQSKQNKTGIQLTQSSGQHSQTAQL